MNHFYAGQVIITWWPLEPTRSYNDIFIHWIQVLAQTWIEHHSNKHYGVLDNVPGFLATQTRALNTSHPALAINRTDFLIENHNLLLVNIAQFQNPDLSLNQTNLDIWLNAQLPKLKNTGGPYPFWRIYILGHGDPFTVVQDARKERAKNQNIQQLPEAPYFLSYHVTPTHSAYVPLDVFSGMIKRILYEHPHAIFADYRSSGINHSPLLCRISNTSCYGSAGVVTESPFNQAQELRLNESFSDQLNHSLSASPIPYEILGRLYSVILSTDFMGRMQSGMFGDWRKRTGKFQEIKNASGYTRFSKHQFKKSHRLTAGDPRTSVITDDTYERPIFPEHPQFNFIYTILCLLQKGLSESTKPDLFREPINRILNELKHHAQDNHLYSSMLITHLEHYMAEKSREIDQHEHYFSAMIHSETKSRQIFNEIKRKLEEHKHAPIAL